MLSAPDQLWRNIQTLAPKILNKKAASFVRYCRSQVNKYGIKDSAGRRSKSGTGVSGKSREKHGASKKLSILAKEIDRLTSSNKFLSTREILQPYGSMAPYFEICGKKTLFDAFIKSARVITQRLMDEYGARALAAEKNEGIDWKALSHAVRVEDKLLSFCRHTISPFQDQK